MHPHAGAPTQPSARPRVHSCGPLVLLLTDEDDSPLSRELARRGFELIATDSVLSAMDVTVRLQPLVVLDLDAAALAQPGLLEFFRGETEGAGVPLLLLGRQEGCWVDLDHADAWLDKRLPARRLADLIDQWRPPIRASL
jgi:hypothetical protein